MLFGVEARLEVDPNAESPSGDLDCARSAQSWLNDVHYGTVAVAAPGAEPPSLVAGEPGQHRIAAAGAPYYSIAQSEIAGFALAIHSAPRQPERLAELDVRALRPGRLHLVRALVPVSGFVPRRAPGRRRGQAAHGGRVLFANRGLRRADACCDRREPDPARRPRLSVSYDYGAEINAFAKCYAVAAAEPAC